MALGDRTVRRRAATLLAVACLLMPAPALAVFSGEMSARAPSGDGDYAEGIAARERKDWPAVIAAMERVVGRRPHHDNAWNILGHAYRQVENYEESLDAYGRALSINPHHREAMEYLGEAYLALDRFWEAEKLLDRLASECRRVSLSFSDGDFTDGCVEYVELKTAIDAYAARHDGETVPAEAMTARDDW